MHLVLFVPLDKFLGTQNSNNIIFPFLAYCAFALPTRPPLCQIIQSIVQLALLSLLVTPVRVYLHIFRILCEL